jgi:hypothetical protein
VYIVFADFRTVSAVSATLRRMAVYSRKFFREQLCARRISNARFDDGSHDSADERAHLRLQHRGSDARVLAAAAGLPARHRGAGAVVPRGRLYHRFWGVGHDVAEKMGLIPALRAAGYVNDHVVSVRRAGPFAAASAAKRCAARSATGC